MISRRGVDFYVLQASLVALFAALPASPASHFWDQLDVDTRSTKVSCYGGKRCSMDETLLFNGQNRQVNLSSPNLRCLHQRFFNFVEVKTIQNPAFRTSKNSWEIYRNLFLDVHPQRNRYWGGLVITPFQRDLHIHDLRISIATGWMTINY